jgi:hypothetical protein
VLLSIDVNLNNTVSRWKTWAGLKEKTFLTEAFPAKRRQSENRHRTTSVSGKCLGRKQGCEEIN